MNLLQIDFINVNIKHDTLILQILVEKGTTYGDLYDQLRLSALPENYSSTYQNIIQQNDIIELPPVQVLDYYRNYRYNSNIFKIIISDLINIPVAHPDILCHIFCVECNKTVCLNCYLSQHQNHQACIMKVSKRLQCQCANNLSNLHLQLYDNDDSILKTLKAIINMLFHIQIVSQVDFNIIMANAPQYKNYFIALLFSCVSTTHEDLVQTIKYLNSIEDTVIDETQLKISYSSSFLFYYLEKIQDQLRYKAEMLASLFNVLQAHSELFTSLLIYHINYFMNTMINKDTLVQEYSYLLIKDIGNYFTDKHVNIISNLKLYEKTLFTLFKTSPHKKVEYNKCMTIVQNFKMFKSQYEMEIILRRNPICLYYLNKIYINNTRHFKLFPYIKHDENQIKHIFSYNILIQTINGFIFSVVFKNLFQMLQQIEYSQEVKDSIVSIVHYILDNMNISISEYEQKHFSIGLDFDVFFMILFTIPIYTGNMRVQEFQITPLEIAQLITTNCQKLYNIFRFLQADSLPQNVDEYIKVQQKIFQYAYNEHIIYIAIDFVKLFITQSDLRNLIINFILNMYIVTKQKQYNFIGDMLTQVYNKKNKALNPDVFNYEQKHQHIQRFLEKIKYNQIHDKIKHNTTIKKQISTFCQFIHQLLFQSNMTLKAMKKYVVLSNKIKPAFVLYQNMPLTRLYGATNYYLYAETCLQYNQEIANISRSFPAYVSKDKTVLEPSNIDFILQNLFSDDNIDGKVNTDYQDTLYYQMQNNFEDDFKLAISELLTVYQYFHANNIQNSVNTFVIQRLEIINQGYHDYNTAENSSGSNLNKLKSMLNKYKASGVKNNQLLISQVKSNNTSNKETTSTQLLQIPENMQPSPIQKENQLCSICHEGGDNLMLRCQIVYVDSKNLPLIKFCPHLIHRQCNTQQKCPICGFNGNKLLSINKRDMIILISLIYWQFIEKSCQCVEKSQRDKVITHHKMTIQFLSQLMNENGLEIRPLDSKHINDESPILLPKSTLEILQKTQGAICLMCEKSLSTSYPDLVICMTCGQTYHRECIKKCQCCVCQQQLIFFVTEMLLIDQKRRLIFRAPYMTLHGQYLYKAYGDIQFLSSERLAYTLDALVFGNSCKLSSKLLKTFQSFISKLCSDQNTLNRKIFEARRQYKQVEQKKSSGFLFPILNKQKCLQDLVNSNVQRRNVRTVQIQDVQFDENAIKTSSDLAALLDRHCAQFQVETLQSPMGVVMEVQGTQMDSGLFTLLRRLFLLRTDMAGLQQRLSAVRVLGTPSWRRECFVREFEGAGNLSADSETSSSRTSSANGSFYSDFSVPQLLEDHDMYSEDNMDFLNDFDDFFDFFGTHRSPARSTEHSGDSAGQYVYEEYEEEQESSERPGQFQETSEISALLSVSFGSIPADSPEGSDRGGPSEASQLSPLSHDMNMEQLLGGLTDVFEQLLGYLHAAAGTPTENDDQDDPTSSSGPPDSDSSGLC